MPERTSRGLCGTRCKSSVDLILGLGRPWSTGRGRATISHKVHSPVSESVEKCFVNGLEVLMNVRDRVVQTVSPMQNLDGGFGGGHGQTSHCAPSYAAILSLAMVGGKESLDMIDRRALHVAPSLIIMILGANSLSVQVEMVG